RGDLAPMCGRQPGLQSPTAARRGSDLRAVPASAYGTLLPSHPPALPPQEAGKAGRRKAGALCCPEPLWGVQTSTVEAESAQWSGTAQRIFARTAPRIFGRTAPRPLLTALRRRPGPRGGARAELATQNHA